MYRQPHKIAYTTYTNAVPLTTPIVRVSFRFLNVETVRLTLRTMDGDVVQAISPEPSPLHHLSCIFRNRHALNIAILQGEGNTKCKGRNHRGNTQTIENRTTV